MTPIISFDPMKLQKDVVNNQPSKTLIDTIITTVKNNFPGVTYIAVSVPINTTSEFQAHGTNPSPLSIEDFTALWIDEIHNAGYGVVLRGTACECEKIWNFPLHVDNHSYFVNKGLDFLNRMKPHLKNGDICGIYPELEGHIWDGTGACINDTGNQSADYNTFYVSFVQAIKDWSTTNNIHLFPYITINRSELISGWVQQPFFQAMGAVVYDYYGDNQTIQEMPGKIDEAFNKYHLPLYQQEWGDTRSASTVAADPTHTAQMAQVFFDKIKSGEMIGINFWNLFDTPQEGILTINGNNVSLNAKGIPLASTFQKNFGSQQPVPPPPTPTPNPIPTPTPTPQPTPQPNPVPPTPIPPAPTPLPPITYTGTFTGTIILTPKQ
jgi:hypothetical protein